MRRKNAFIVVNIAFVEAFIGNSSLIQGWFVFLTVKQAKNQYINLVVKKSHFFKEKMYMRLKFSMYFIIFLYMTFLTRNVEYMISWKGENVL